MNRKLLLVLILSVLALLVLFPTAGGAASANAPGPGMAQAGTPEPASPADTPSVDPLSAPAPTSPLEEIISTRTPEPTATPDRLERQVEELVETVGLGRTTWLGLSVVNWTNLASFQCESRSSRRGGAWEPSLTRTQATVAFVDDGCYTLDSHGGVTAAPAPDARHNMDARCHRAVGK
jgi:hypothetical protein